MLIKPDGGLFQTKTEEALTRDQIRMFTTFEAMLDRMGLQYWMRCRKCLEAGDPQNGVTGRQESNASIWIAECNCTKRVYRGSDAPLSSELA